MRLKTRLFGPLLRLTLVLPMLVMAPAALSKTILVLGDSISAGYGIAEEEGWVALWQQSLGDQHLVVNGSISGETTAGGLARLPQLLQTHKPDFVLIELGGNDGLRGYPVRAMRENLEKMIALSEQAGAVPLLMQIRIPPNYGARYSKQFFDAYARVAEENDVVLLPFFLEPLVDDLPRYIQEDGIHPRAIAQPLMMEEVRKAVAPLLSATAKE